MNKSMRFFVMAMVFSMGVAPAMAQQEESAIEKEARLTKAADEAPQDWQKQFDAAKFSINAGSLYFSAIANGYSRFFTTDMLTKLIEDAGFTVEKIVDNLGISNSMFICKKRV